VLHAIALAHYAIVFAHAWAVDSINARVRLAAENDRLHEECALLREEIRLKDHRIAQIPPQRRPHYGPHERMAILELRAARGWSLKHTADTFFLIPATIASWMPFSLPQCWPFCWCVAVVIDHYSRRIMGMAIFSSNPTSLSVQRFLNRVIDGASATPKYIVSDKGPQFWCDLFKDWCDRQGITPRFGAVGQHGSISLVERFILTLKNECTRVILVPLRSEAFRQELSLFAYWYAENRPHSGLHGNTPNEVYQGIPPANQRPRIEPRIRWPRRAPCASPHAPAADDCGAIIRLDVCYHGERKHLPVVALRRAA
jgi:transposase InsO family protein